MYRFSDYVTKTKTKTKTKMKSNGEVKVKNTTVGDYVKSKRGLSDSENEKNFTVFAETFAEVDSDTQKFRDRFNDAGFSVVFRGGVNREDTLRVLESQGMKNLLAK